MTKHERKPADPGSGPVAQFGYDLRQLRQKNQLSHAAVARRSYYSRTCIHNADFGYQLPTEAVVKGFVEACGEDPASYVRRRGEIADELAASKSTVVIKGRQRKVGAMPDPQYRTDKALYVDGLKQLFEWSGLTFRELHQITKERGCDPVLPASSWCRELGRGDPDRLPRKPMVASFLKAIDLTADEQKLWLDQWSAVFHGYAAPQAHPAWAKLSTGAHALARGNLPSRISPMDTVRDWRLDDDGSWVEVTEDATVTATARLSWTHWLRRHLRRVIAAGLALALIAAGLPMLLRNLG